MSKTYDKKEVRKAEIEIMLDQAKDMATITRETRLLVARKASENMPEMLSAQIEKAKNGDTNAFIAVWDRAFGKPLQAIKHTGENETPILFMPSVLIEKYTLQLVKPVAMEAKVIDVQSESTAQPSPEI